MQFKYEIYSFFLFWNCICSKSSNRTIATQLTKAFRLATTRLAEQVATAKHCRALNNEYQKLPIHNFWSHAAKPLTCTEQIWLFIYSQQFNFLHEQIHSSHSLTQSCKPPQGAETISNDPHEPQRVIETSKTNKI